MKVLIIAFPRSGTSLTYRIFKRHMDIKNMFYESLILWRHKGKNIKHLFKKGLGDGVNGGEKIIYEKPFIGKTEETRYIDYCDMWNDMFGDEARIIQIVRHPYDQWNSVIRKKYIARRITHTIPNNLRKYFNSVPEYTQRTMEYPNSISIKYEDLTGSPKNCMTRLYKFCGLDPKRTNFNENIKTGKTFWYKDHGHIIDTDKRVIKVRDEYWKIMNKNIHKVLDVYNQIPGPKYEV